MDNLITDFLMLQNDINDKRVKWPKFLVWFYDKIIAAYYYRRIFKSLDQLKEDTLILSTDQIKELIYYTSNTFNSENGSFGNISSSLSTTFHVGTKEEYTMYSARVILDTHGSCANIKTYDNQDDFEINFYGSIIDMNSRKGASFTLRGQWLMPTKENIHSDYQSEYIAELNKILKDTIKDYIYYVFER